MTVQDSSQHVAVDNGLIRVDASVDAGQLALSLSARNAGGGSVPVLARVGANSRTDAYCVEVPENCTLEVDDALTDGIMLTVRGVVVDLEFAMSLRLRAGSPWVEISEVLAAPERQDEALVGRFEAVWRFVGWEEPGEVFSPVLIPEENDVVGQHVMRAPALIAQADGRAAALVYDTDSVGKIQTLPACMSLVREEDRTPVFRAGLRSHHVRGHVYYSSNPTVDPSGELTVPRPLHFRYSLFVAAEVAPGAALSAASRYLWTHVGSRYLRSASPLPATLEDLAHQIYPRVFAQRWAETELGGRRVGAVRANRSYVNDVWMCPWFNQLRSAYGLYFWGRQTGNDDWTGRALATRDLVLAAPQDRGLFPTVFVFGEASAASRWVHSHHQGGGPGIYHLFDMSWTVYQLLRWHRDLHEDVRMLDFARAYCSGIAALQFDDGGLPAYVDAERFVPLDRIDRVKLIEELDARGPGDRYVRYGLEKMWVEDRFVHSAEDAGSLLVLAELVRLLRPDDPDRAAFLSAATRLANWLEVSIYPESRWIDFEVYYSCSPKPLDFYDRRSGQWPQNTLCMHAAAAGFLALYGVTHDIHHLDLAHRAMDLLSLYQQVWDPPFLNFDGFGGYGVMNTDGEWSDARQAQFADTHLDYYLTLGAEEHLERALAACRAGFTTAFLPVLSSFYPTGWHRQPQGIAAENHAHGGRDGLCGVSGFDWGVGSALATAAYFRLHGVL